MLTQHAGLETGAPLFSMAVHLNLEPLSGAPQLRVARVTLEHPPLNVLDIPAIFRALIAVRMAGHVGFEHEIDPKDPMPGVGEDVGYVRGVLRMLPA